MPTLQALRVWPKLSAPGIRPHRLDRATRVLRRRQLCRRAALVHGGHRVLGGFAATISLDTLKQTPGLEDMMVTRKGSRLSGAAGHPRRVRIFRKLGRAKRDRRVYTLPRQAFRRPLAELARNLLWVEP